MGKIPFNNQVVFLSLKAKERIMFSFFSFDRLKRILSVGFILLAMAAVLGGCDSDPGSFVDDNELNTALIGTWREYWGTEPDEYDGYIISETQLSYGYGSSVAYAGTIKYVSNFSASSGVIIIEYEPGSEAEYIEYDAAWTYVATHPCTGNFSGIYYKNLQSGSVEISQAINIANNLGAEEVTLEAAKAAFTSGNTGNYVSRWGGPYLRFIP